jgi:hypothetical protein
MCIEPLGSALNNKDAHGERHCFSSTAITSPRSAEKNVVALIVWSPHRRFVFEANSQHIKSSKYYRSQIQPAALDSAACFTFFFTQELSQYMPSDNLSVGSTLPYGIPVRLKP